VKKLIYRSCVNHATKKKQKGNEIDVRKAVKTSEVSYLFEQGALPFKQVGDDDELVSFVGGSGTTQ
jgi:hypothetical protein